MTRDFKYMLDAPVKVDNLMVWDGAKRPFFEAYYMRVVDREAKWSLLIRYTLTTSTAKQVNDIASVWAIFTDQRGKKIALKEDFDLQKHDVFHTDHFININTSFLSLADTYGTATQETDCIKWEFVFEDPVISLRLMNQGVWNRLFSRLFCIQPHFTQPRMFGFASGNVFIAGSKKETKRTRIHQGHFHSTAFSHEWNWINCIEFKEDSEAFFEAISIKVPILKKWSTILNFFYVCMDGKRFAANSFLKALFFNSSHYNNETGDLCFTSKGYKFICHIKRTPSLTTGIHYQAPNGARAFLYHDMLASIEIKVYKKHRKQWQYYKTLSSQNKCSFETVSHNKINALPLDNE